MSKRRKSGEIVTRNPGSGFVSSADPKYLIIPTGRDFELSYARDDGRWTANPNGDAGWCMLSCGDPDCKEYPNIEIAFGEHKGETLCHLSECETHDLTDADKKELEEKYGYQP